MVYLLTQTIEKAAEAFPEKHAFRYNQQFYTYQDLLDKSNQLALHLRDQGVKKGDRIGIFMNRSLETALAVYGIMRAGAAFVPMDPYAPASRTQFLIQDCGLKHLISTPSQSKKLKDISFEGTRLQSIIGLEDHPALTTTNWETIFGLPTHWSHPRILSDDLAYIMYTSGTTGQPKGIMHSHYSGLSYAKLSSELYEVGPDDRLGNHAALHFDISTMGYFTMPYSAGTTVIVPEIHTKLPASLSQLIEKEKLTIWYSVPLALTQLLQKGVLEQRDLSALKWVLFGGEPFPAKHLNSLMKYWPEATFCNVYGPAEVNQCTYHHIKEFPNEAEAIPLGKIWDNTEGLILDEDDQAVPEGAIGELLIRSATRMKGYWSQPELTQKSLYHQKDKNGNTKTFYRTGDLVKLNKNNDLLFFGRKDRQIKTRGYRVELDEVQEHLNSYPGIIEAAVYPVRVKEETQIFASVVLQETANFDDKKLSQFLKSLIPWYAVPTRFFQLKEIPRTAAGKTDHKQLQTNTLKVLQA